MRVCMKQIPANIYEVWRILSCHIAWNEYTNIKISLARSLSLDVIRELDAIKTMNKAKINLEYDAIFICSLFDLSLVCV